MVLINEYIRKYLYSEETYWIIGICQEIHRILGKGMSEVIYKDALEYDLLQNNITYEREKEFIVKYKDIILSHKFYADFIVFDKIILEIKAQKGVADEHYNQVINYLVISKCKIGLIINFGGDSLITKRVIF